MEISRAHSSASLKEARQALTELAAAYDEANLKPASETAIIKALNGIAEAFQVDLPSAVGLEIYVAALSDLPRPALAAAVRSLVRSHKWMKMPLPADFIAAAKDELEQIEAGRRRIATARNRITEALSHKA